MCSRYFIIFHNKFIMKQTNLVLNISLDNNRQILKQVKKPQRIEQSFSKLKRIIIKSQRRDPKTQFPKLTKFVSLNKFVASDRYRKQDMEIEQNGQKKSLDLLQPSKKHSEKKQNFNESFEDFNLQKSHQLFQRNSIKYNIVKPKIHHSKKFSEICIMKTQVIPQKKVFETVQPKIVNNLSKILKFDTVVSQRTNQESILLFHPSYWKNKDSNKVIQNKIKMSLSRKSKEAKQRLNKSSI